MDLFKKPATAAGSYISEDVLIGILLRLPLKSLARFRCVSQQWRSLINGPNFFHRLKPNSTTEPPSTLLLHPVSRIRYLGHEKPLAEPLLLFAPIINTNSHPNSPLISSQSLVDLRASHINYVWNSCNGLLLCSDHENHFVVNPTTKKFKKLPRLPDRLLDDTDIIYNVGLSLAFDPIPKSTTCYPPNDRYKVVCVMSTWDILHRLRFQPLTLYQILIYSSDTEEWKLSGPSFALKYNMNVHFDCAVYCNGAIHWYSESKKSLYLNVESERVGTLGMPETLKIRYFGSSRGRLHIIDYYDRTNLKVYEMRSDYSSWVVKHEIQFGRLIDDLPRHAGWGHYFSIHCYVRGRQRSEKEEEEEEEEEFLVIQIPNYHVRYNLKEKKFDKKMLRLPSAALDHCDNYDFVRYGWFDVFPYFESLACV